MVINSKPMLKYGILCYLFLFCSCSNSSKPSKQDTTIKTEGVSVSAIDNDTTVKPVIEPTTTTTTEDDEIVLTDSINFAKYASEVLSQTTKAEVNFANYPEAKQFKTRILEGYKTGEVNFAGHYIAIYFGCGAGCIMGFMVDVNDGEIYDLPLGEENMCFWTVERALYTSHSKLFISSICKETDESKELYYIAFLWNEEEKAFEPVKSEAFIVK